MWPELVCPEDGSPLDHIGKEVICPNGHRWKNHLGISRMVSEDHNYADAFGIQWNVYRHTQLDSYTRTSISYDRARRCLGEDCWALLHHSTRSDCLEVGCGAGRFTEVLLNTGAYVTSVDYSSAVEANQANFPQNQQHRVIQVDALRLPFHPQQFELVFCLGVIQHTPNPEETIKKLFEQVKPGGWLVIDHYTHSFSWYTKSAFLFRLALRRLPPDKGLEWTERLVKFFFPLHRIARKNRLAQILLSRVSPVWSYYHIYPQLNDQLQQEWAFLDTHDSLTDWYKHRRTKEQIERTLQALGAVDITCEYGGNGVEARCRRQENDQ